MGTNYESITALNSEALEFLNNENSETQENGSEEEDFEIEIVDEVEGIPEETNQLEEGKVATTEEDGIEGSDDQPITELEIEGVGKVTPEQIMEWRSGNLRQSDYTKKTQELARQREQMHEALELFEHLKKNPQLIEAIAENGDAYTGNVVRTATPEHEAIQQIMYNQKSLEVDLKLNDLRSRYGDFDETQLFERATALGTEDLETVLKSMKYETVAGIDENAIIEKAKKQLMAELEAKKSSVATVVSSKSGTVAKNKVTLTKEEQRIADGMGISYKDYVKWRK